MAPSTSVQSADASGRVDSEQILKASKALLKHMTTDATSQDDYSTKKKKNLLTDPDSPAGNTPVWLTLTTKNHIHPNARFKPGLITLPHPLNTDEDSTICLIVADPQRAYKDIVASDEFPESLRKRITRVIDFTHLKAKFRAYEAQRKLASEHDIFLADDRIVTRLPKTISTFYKTTTKRPVPVVFMAARERVDGKRVPRPRSVKKEKRDPAENANARPAAEIATEVIKAVSAALVWLSPSTNTSVRVGYGGWTAEALAANVERVAGELVERFVPKKWDNVRSIYIKGPETAALPIYQTDELWLDETQVVPDDQAPLRVLPGKKVEKANIGKKRKSADATAEEEAPKDEEEQSAKRPKKKAKKALPESNDDKLDKEIADRKSKLRKQKSAAKKALEA